MAKLKRRLATLERALEKRFGITPGLQPPILVTQLVGTRRDSEGRLLGPNHDFTRAAIGDRVFDRNELETLRDFEARVTAAMRACGQTQATFESADVTDASPAA
jgi:hypothetical protein